jgi:hypothetical protein
MGSFIICTHHQISLGRSIKENETDRACNMHGRGEEKRGMCRGFWWESPKKKDHFKDQGVDGIMGLEWILGRLPEGVWSGFTWLGIGASGRLS